MKNCRIILAFFILINHWSAGQENSSNVAEHYQTKNANIAIFPASSSELFIGTERFTPTRKDIDQAEKALSSQLAKLNSTRENQAFTPVIDKNLPKYKRQYFGYLDKNGNKILFINCFWRKDKDGEGLWLKERIRVLDGGSYFWNVKYNLNSDELFDLDVNGDV